MEELEILKLLTRHNPWWENKPIPPSKLFDFKRGDFFVIKNLLKRREIAAIIGPRRVGKTVLMHQLIKNQIEEGIDPKRILYFSLDDTKLNATNLQTVFETYEKYVLKNTFDSVTQTHFLYLDEIQELDEWQKILKNWYDFGYNLKFTISGSSSLWISKGTEESLIGRITTSVMMPMKFSEVLRYHNILPEDYFKQKNEAKKVLLESADNSDEIQLTEYLNLFMANIMSKKETIEIALHKYLIAGGYPEFLEENDYETISELLRNKIKLTFYKDIVRYFNIKNAYLLDDLFTYLSKTSGNYINITETAKLLNIERPTLKNYLEYLKKTFLIETSEFYTQSRKKRMRKQEKVYVLDPGILNATNAYLDETLLTNPSQLGMVAESTAFDHLMRLQYHLEPGPLPQIYYWKNKKEIDFVLTIKHKAIPIESKYGNTIPAETITSIKSFISEHQSPFGIIITQKRFGSEGKVIMIPLWAFLLII